MSLKWTNKLEKTKGENKPREVIEAENILKDIFSLDVNRGAKTTLTLGVPGSVKTGVDCHFVNYFIHQHPEDVKIFWRNSLNAAIQVFKLPKWHIYIEENSGVRLFDRHTGKDVTQKFERKQHLTYFTTFNELYDIAKPGICNAVFFKDIHMKEIEYDMGTLQWFKFYEFLQGFYDWSCVVFDEWHEMAKRGTGGLMWKMIRDHSNALSNARKNHVITHGNCHQTSEMDDRVVENIMIFIQMYGSKRYKHNMVTKNAVAGLPKPSDFQGAWAWISEGGRYGRFQIKEMYILPESMSISAKIISKYEKTKTCPICHHHFTYKNKTKIYCSRACEQEAYRRRRNKKEKKTDKT